MMDWSERGNIRGNPSARTQFIGADRRTSRGSKKKKPLGAQPKCQEKKQEKANAAPQADGGPGARGAHSGESCTGTDVDTGCNSRTKRLLSPGGTPQDAQIQVKRTKQKQTETPYNS